MIRKIIHIDMDYFYAAVEIRHAPHLADKPVAVGGRPEERSVLCTANYIARRFGVHSAISSAKALKLCPQLVLIPVDFEKYEKESEAIHEIFSRFTDKIEFLSLDEAFLDVTNCPLFHGSATLIAQEIRRLIKQERNLTASAGVAPNKLVAKIASELNKPNGQFVVTPSQIESLMNNLPVRKLFGIGKVTEEKFNQIGIKTCGDLKKYSREKLCSLFGHWGEELYYLCRGIDERPVETESTRKSLGVEWTYPEDLPDLPSCQNKLPKLYEEWIKRFIEIKNQYRIVSLWVKIKFFDFESTVFERTSNVFIPSIDQFELLMEKAYSRQKKPVRLLGIGSKITPSNDNPQLHMEI